MKSFWKKILAIMLGVAMLFSVVACSDEVDNTEESKEIKIKIVKAGYDVTWLDKVVTEFNKTFTDEGYTAKVVLADTSIGALNEIKTPKRNDTDLYFEYNNVDELVKASRSILGADGGALLEDLSDVYNSKSIGLDKQEQGENIIDRMDTVDVDYCKYKGSLPGYDGIYAIPYQGGQMGICINTKVLTDKGYTLADLSTTNSLLSIVEALKPANITDQNGFFPVAWASSNAPGYWDYMAQVLFAQYTGKTNYENFWNFIPSTGTTEANGYDVYKDRGIYEALKVIEALTNNDYAVPGTSSMEHIAAQARVLNEKSLFVVSGDWFYKEMEKDYADKLDNVLRIKTPVVSALGIKLGLCGTAHEVGSSCATCESKLKEIVVAVDAGKSVDTIATETSISKEKVQTIYEARGYVQNDMPSVVAYIPSYANAKAAAKTFLRFLYSDEMNDVYLSDTNVSLPIERVNALDMTKLDAKQKAMYEISYGANVSNCYSYKSSAVRVGSGMNFLSDSGDASKYRSLAYSHSAKGEQDLAKKMFDDVYKDVSANWTTYLQQSGLES